MNGVRLADGTSGGIDLQPGNNTVLASTSLDNGKLSDWWVAFLKANETVRISAAPSAQVNRLVSATVDLPRDNRTVFGDATPIITSLSKVSAGLEGCYTRTLSGGDLRREGNGLLGDTLGSMTEDANVTVGYEIERGWATWGTVTENTTILRLHFRVHNPSETVPMLAEPKNLAVEIDMNDVELFTARGDYATFANLNQGLLGTRGGRRSGALAGRDDRGSLRRRDGQRPDWTRATPLPRAPDQFRHGSQAGTHERRLCRARG
ncbi:MAG: hypothetical protein ABEI98_01670 [Halorhabdus sp.]